MCIVNDALKLIVHNERHSEKTVVRGIPTFISCYLPIFYIPRMGLHLFFITLMSDLLLLLS